jgi:outer membrane immunogenic protein
MLHRFTALLIAAASTVALGQIASAADMPVKAPRAPIYAPPYNWTGFYLGLNLGGSWGRQDASFVNATTGTILATGSNHLDGIIGGGQIGYNWQVNQWVLGVEADFQGSGQKADGSFFDPGAPCGPNVAACFPIPATTISYTDKLNWFGTVRGRLGIAFDRWLPYVTGGWAYGHGEISGTTTVGAVATAFSASQNYSGWTIGGGVEWAFADHWSAKLEYLYIDFGDGPIIPATTLFNVNVGHMTDNIVRAGVNYKF